VWSRNIKNGCSIYIYDISHLRVNLVLNGGKLSALRPDYFMCPDIIWTASLAVLYVLCSGCKPNAVRWFFTLSAETFRLPQYCDRYGFYTIRTLCLYFNFVEKGFFFSFLFYTIKHWNSSHCVLYFIFLFASTFITKRLSKSRPYKYPFLPLRFYTSLCIDSVTVWG